VFYRTLSPPLTVAPSPTQAAPLDLLTETIHGRHARPP
jgi:hypothetical protein